jgi:hypothetical protein
VKKVKLNIDDLVVESFDATVAGRGWRGTILGQATNTCDPCGPDTETNCNATADPECSAECGTDGGQPTCSPYMTGCDDQGCSDYCSEYCEDCQGVETNALTGCTNLEFCSPSFAGEGCNSETPPCQ